MKYKLFQVDAFTQEKFLGNPAGVVLKADGLTDGQMQDIAREMNCSETAFILSPSGPDHDVWLRYFTPKVEVPICGHATIAAHYVRAKVNNISFPARVISKTGVGILPVDIAADGDDCKVTMTQGKIEFGDILNGSQKDALFTALGIESKDIDPRCPIQIVSTGHSKVMIGIKTRQKLNALNPDFSSLSTLSRTVGSNGYFVFTFDSGDPGALTAGRMFAPVIGINEDPVTGNANGPLGAYLVHHKLVEAKGPVFRFNGKQGEAIHRTGHVEVTVHIENAAPVKVQVGGNAVIVFETELAV